MINDVIVKDDRTVIDKLIADYDNFNVEYNIGLFDSTDSEEAQKGIYNEFGTSTAPPRPFIEPTILSNEKFLIKKIESELKKLSNPNIFLNDLANIMLNKTRNKIDKMKYPVLSAATIERKGHAKLLKDTYKMYNAIKIIKIKGKEGE